MSENPNPLHDFRNFLFVVWQHLQLPNPTPIQYEIAHYIQHGPDMSVIEGFRGVGKSFVLAAYVLWVLYMDPQKKIMVVSASGGRAANFTTFCLRLIEEMPMLRHLRPGPDQRRSSIKFDVGPAMADQSPSVKSVGINGQLTGDRADLVIPDDVEIPKNSATEAQREKLRESIKEFAAVLKPGGKIKFLGTPQCDQSIYNGLAEKGYAVRIWPARYPDASTLAFYGDRMSPLLAGHLLADPTLEGTPCEPIRFSDEDLLMREGQYGRSGFRLQFMLDTRLSDGDRYPLRLSDFITMKCNPELAPEKPIWSNGLEFRWGDLPMVGLSGDGYYRPAALQGSREDGSTNWLPYTTTVMYVDPSGRGKDETAYAVGRFLNGFIYVVETGGFREGYTPEVFKQLVAIAKKHSVRLLKVEANYGDGMFSSLLRPHFEAEYPVTIEEEKVSGQKELRIIDTLEPVLTQHRLVLDSDLVRRDFESTQSYATEDGPHYRLLWQLTHLTRERGSLPHDDRLDALSGMVRHFTELVRRDADKAIKSQRENAFDEELRKFAEGVGVRYRRQEPRWASVHKS